MDAFQDTRPILSVGAHHGPSKASKRAASTPADALVDVRRYVQQLPLGYSPGPPITRRRPSPREAARAVEGSLRTLAGVQGVAAAADEPVAALARRLLCCHGIAGPAADAVVILLPLLVDGASDEAVKLAERLVGYLDHRIDVRARALGARPWRRRQ